MLLRACLLAAVLASACSPASVPATAPAAKASVTASAPRAAADAPSASVTAAPAASASASASPRPTPSSTCRPGAALTPEQTEGPFYKSNPPQRASLLEAGTQGTRLVLSGAVRGSDCRPIAGARVDFWQTDAAGVYDNAGYRFRGYQLTDAEGSYQLTTVVPAEYPGRTVHIHVKVTPPGGPTLTSQLYLPGVARNATDGIFRPELVVADLTRGPDGATARFDFIVATP